MSITTTSYSPEEAQRFLDDIDAFVDEMHELHPRFAQIGIESPAKGHLKFISKILFHLGSLALQFSEQIKVNAGVYQTETLAYQVRTIFETVCLLSYLTRKPTGLEMEIEIERQMKKDAFELYMAILPSASSSGSRLQMQRTIDEYQSIFPKPKRWMPEITAVGSPYLESELKETYPLFNKMAHPTAYGLFLTEVYPEEIFLLRARYLSKALHYLRHIRQIIPAYLTQEGIQFEQKV